MAESTTHRATEAAAETVEPHAASRGVLAFLPQVIGALLAIGALQFTFGGEQPAFDAVGMTRGHEWVTVIAKLDGAPIQGAISDAPALIDAWQNRGEKPVGLHLGNSQIFGVLRYQPGQKNTVEPLFERFEPLGIDVLTFAEPAETLCEHYITVAHLLPRLKPKFVIVPVMMVSQRTENVRAEIAVCARDPATRQALEQTDIGRRLAERAGKESAAATGDDLGALRETPQERTETAINDWLDSHWRLWAVRGKIRTQILESAIAFRRELIMAATVETKRRVPKASLEANIEALAALLKSAQEHGVPVFVYSGPFRHDFESPYFDDQYLPLLSQVERLADEHGAVFANLDKAVSDSHYGSMSIVKGQPDRWHFDEQGHHELADRIADEIQSRVLQP